MSKKNKAKFKRQIKNQILTQMSHLETKTTETTLPKQENNRQAPARSNAAVATLELQNLPQIKADLRKTLIVVASMVILVAVLMIVDQKHHLLVPFGNWLFRVLHIQ